MTDDLNEIKHLFKHIEKRRLTARLKLIVWALAIIGGTLFLFAFSKRSLSLYAEPSTEIELTCHISKTQKKMLIDKITRTAACGKTSKMAIYKALKRHFKYETISKMLCNDFDEAEKFLNEANITFCD